MSTLVIYPEMQVMKKIDVLTIRFQNYFKISKDIMCIMIFPSTIFMITNGQFLLLPISAVTMSFDMIWLMVRS